jgi:hypothetical protein
MIKVRTILLAIVMAAGMIYHHRAMGQMCPKSSGTELIVNGDFSAGNVGFTTGYSYNASAVTPGTYSIGTNPNTLNSYFANMGDHTTGTGNMLIVDVDNVPGKVAYSTTVTGVLPNTTYFFSAWFADVNRTFENPPRLQFSIGGTPLGAIVNVNPDRSSHAWEQFYVVWNSGAHSGPLTIQIQNMRTESNGNDLALDDISFSTSCDNITDLESLGLASALPDTIYNCNVAFPFELDPGLPGTYDFKWKKTSAAVLGNASTYFEPATPADQTKVYLCYEYVAGCPRMDSVIFLDSPLTVELGADKVMCEPVSIPLNSGVTSPPVDVQWYRNGTPIATTANIIATSVGTYRVEVSRPGCGTAFDEVQVTAPTNTLSGSGEYCPDPPNPWATFEVTGSTQVKWYTTAVGGTELNPSDFDPEITLPLANTNTTTPGCDAGLYAQDMSSYPGVGVPSAPCGTTDPTNQPQKTLIEVTQSAELSSVDLVHLPAWGNTATFQVQIFNNSPTGGPWCGSCSPAGQRNTPTGGALASATITSTLSGSSAVRTVSFATPVTLAPGRYWIVVNTSGGSLGRFNCTPAYAAGSDLFQTPIADNTGNNVVSMIGAHHDNGISGSGGIFNIQFQVGSSNACSRLFICAVENCLSPVEYLSFEAKKYSNGNILLWETASESNSDYFIVERSYDGKHFEAIGTVKAAGHSQTRLSYTFLDATAAASATVVYYRLNQIDFDKTSNLSVIKTVYSNGAEPEVRIYPVPVPQGQQLTLEYIGLNDETILVEITDNLGKVVSSANHTVESGINTIELNTNSFAGGMYYLRLLGSTVQTLKFVVE